MKTVAGKGPKPLNCWNSSQMCASLEKLVVNLVHIPRFGFGGVLFLLFHAADVTAYRQQLPSVVTPSEL